MTIQMVTNEDFLNPDQALKAAENNVRRVFGEKMKVDFQMLEKIKRDKNGKLRKIVSNIPL